MSYVLQLNPSSARAPTFHVSWPDYWAGLGYVESPQRAVKFRTKRDAQLAMRGILAGLNGCIDVVSLKTALREVGK